MEKINAEWEKRNLEVSCIELNINKTDPIDEVSSVLSSTDAEYIVAKTPVADFELSQLLMHQGFQFIEASIRLSHSLSQPKLNDKQTEIIKKTSVYNASKPDLAVINKNIKNGMFHSDRVYLDPYFTKDAAGNRYINWINDELSRDCLVYIIRYNDEAIGFSAISRSADNYNQFLMGLFPEFHGKGLGFSIIYVPIEEIKRLGGKQLTTTVSANNIPSLKTHLKSGFSITNIEYVFIKHNGGK